MRVLSMDSINIYFSGSIKGGRQLVDRYAVMIQTLSRYGKVLTEHIGDSNYAKDGYTQPQTIYNQDKAYMDNSQIMVADITVPSLGVGYELAYAEAHNIPVVCLCESSTNASSMIIGNSYFQCYSYIDTNDALTIIDKVMTKYTMGDK